MWSHCGLKVFLRTFSVLGETFIKIPKSIQEVKQSFRGQPHHHQYLTAPRVDLFENA